MNARVAPSCWIEDETLVWATACGVAARQGIAARKTMRWSCMGRDSCGGTQSGCPCCSRACRVTQGPNTRCITWCRVRGGYERVPRDTPSARESESCLQCPRRVPYAVADPMPPIERRKVPPPKICASCGRPFTWRKKWERDWEQVRYCSDACRRAGPREPDAGAPSSPEPRRRR